MHGAQEGRHRPVLCGKADRCRGVGRIQLEKPSSAVLCDQFKRRLHLVALGEHLSRTGNVLGELLQCSAQSIGVRVIGQTTQRSLSAQL